MGKFSKNNKFVRRFILISLVFLMVGGLIRAAGVMSGWDFGDPASLYSKGELPVVGTIGKLKKLIGNQQNTNGGKYWAMDGEMAPMEEAQMDEAPRDNGAASPTGDAKADSDDYSGTNVQVKGVDEADVVKTDGQYIYQANQRRIVIAKVSQPEKMEVASIVEFEDQNFNPNELYVDGNHLIVIGNAYREIMIREPNSASPSKGEPMYDKPGVMPWGQSSAKVLVYDITDCSAPKMSRELEIEGCYVSSRKIDSAVYLVTNRYIPYFPQMPQEMLLPSYYDSSKSQEFVSIKASEIRYFPEAIEPNYIIIAGFDLEQPNKEVNISTYMGSGQNIYVSRENMYVVVNKYEQVGNMPEIRDGNATSTSGTVSVDISVDADFDVIDSPGAEPTEPAPADMPGSVEPIEPMPAEDLPNIDAKPTPDETPSPDIAPAPIYMPTFEQKTQIYKFSLKGGKATFVTEGEVPGNILNQFSMDEYNGHFRIATTRGDMWRNDEYTSKNNIYVLNDSLEITGSVENIAPGERIYSVRFMGDRGYMVTFKTVDPLFVIDLKDPKAPKILGALKIPGYSDYLHPYDENHIIGFGKDAIEVKQQYGSMAFYLGMKIAIFDVTDVTNPIEMFSEKIGDRGTDSELLYNHKALLFNREKNLLAFPVTLMEVKDKNAGNDGNDIPEYGSFAYQGAYVYNIDLEKGFDLKGRITHHTSEDYKNSMDCWYDNQKYVKRILYIGDNLYTISDGFIKANGLTNLKEKGLLAIPGYSNRKYKDYPIDDIIVEPAVDVDYSFDGSIEPIDNIVPPTETIEILD